MKQHLTKCHLFISIIIFILLLMSNGYPVFAGEVVLNTALSVSIPDQQTGNPGDFLTYVLSFQNRSNSPIDLEIEHLPDPDWNLIGDTSVTIPANTNNFYYPVTIMIPGNAPANLIKKIEIKFKIAHEVFTLPVISIPVFVNPVSTINFDTPAPQIGLNGLIVNHTVTVTNTGNTLERFTVKAVSENDWPLELEPQAFELKQGESRSVTVKHQIPGFSETDYDQVKLQFSWGNQQKMILLTTGVTDKFSKMADRYYIWQGQVSASHPNLTEPGLTDPNLSFSLSGRWKPDSNCQLYFSDIFNETNRRYFTHFKTDSWDVKAGDFSLTWQGLIAPKNSLGNLQAARKDGDRSYAVYAWEPQEGTSTPQPFGLETYLNRNLRFSLLNDYYNDSEQTVFEWDYQTDLRPGLKWTNSLAYSTSDSDGYAMGVGVNRYRGDWYFTSNLQTFKQISDYLDKKRLQLTLYQPLSDEKMTIHNQFIYEARTLEDTTPENTSSINDYDDYNFETIFNWPSGLNIRLSYQYQLIDGAFSKDNTSAFIEDAFEIDRYQHEWWLSHSLDHSADTADSQYSKLNWETKYELSTNNNLIINPQIISNSASSDNESKLGFGFQQCLNYNSLEWKSLLYHYFTSESKYSLECSLDWRIYQYHLALQYIGIWDSADYVTDTFSLTLRKKFSIPFLKPLGTIEGTAFIDKNQNGLLDTDETPLRKAILILDGKNSFETDENGHYALYGLNPGEHQIYLDPLYEVIYLPRNPVTKVTVKQYQNVRLDLPFIRSQNITGTIYFDRNMNGIQDSGEPNLAGIPIDLINIDNIAQNEEPSQTYSNHDGQFTFFQLAPGTYRLNFDDNLLPDNLQGPSELSSIIIDSRHLDENAPLKIGLIPFERPITIIKEEAQLLLSLNQELIKPGETLEIIIESNISMKNLILLLPNGKEIQFKASDTNMWKYQWQVPMNIPNGQVKIKCQGVDSEGKSHQEEALLTIVTG